MNKLKILGLVLLTLLLSSFAYADISYWREETNTNNVWFKINYISGATQTYSISNTSTYSENPQDIFRLFDDFNDGTINTSLWSVTSTCIETAGKIRCGDTTDDFDSAQTVNNSITPAGTRIKTYGYIAPTTKSTHLLTAQYYSFITQFTGCTGICVRDSGLTITATNLSDAYHTFETLLETDKTEIFIADNNLYRTYTGTAGNGYVTSAYSYDNGKYSYNDWMIIADYNENEPDVFVTDLGGGNYEITVENGTTTLNDYPIMVSGITAPGDLNITEGIIYGNFTITAIDSSNSSSINTFNATVDGTFYNTTTGSITTDILLNNTALVNITIESENYQTYSNTSYNVSNGNLQASLVPNFRFQLKDFFDNSTITTFNTTVDGTFFSTSSGEIITLSSSEATSINITIDSAGYQTYSNATYVPSNVTDTFYLSAGTIFFNATQLFTNDTVVGNFTFNSQTKESGETFTRPASGVYNVTFSKDGYYNKTDTINFSSYASNYYTVEDVYNAQINFTANNTRGGASISNFTINYNSTGLSVDSSSSTTTGTVSLNLIQGYNYTFEINATDYALSDTTFDLNFSNTYNFELYTENSLNINIYDEVSRTLINDTNITVEVIGATTDVYTTTNGTLYVDFLTPSEYELRYYSTNIDDYKLRSTFLTVSEQSTQDINLYLLNESDTGITTATITFQVFGSDLSSVEDATVIVGRFYPSLNSYVDIWQRKTTASGVAIGEFETIDAFYQYRVVYEGETKFTSSNAGIQFNADNTIDIFIDTETSLYDDFQTLDDVTYTPINFTQTSNTTGTFYFSYSSDSSVTVCLDVTATSFSGTTTNSTCVTSTGGTLFLPVTAGNYETTFIARANVKVSDELGFQTVDSLTQKLNGLNEPTDSDAWKSNLAWVAVLLTMISAVLFISVNPTVALLFQSITFAAMAFSPIQIIGDLQAAAVVLICIVLLIINARRNT